MGKSSNAIAALVAIAVIGVLVFVFQSVISSADTPLAVETNQPGYPGPGTVLPSLEASTLTSPATEIAEWTANAPTAIPTLGTVQGEQIIQDSSGQISLVLQTGWYASLGGTMILTNYDDEKLTDNHTIPPGGLKIQISVDEVDSEGGFDQWLAKWIDVNTAPPPGSDQPSLIATEPQPYVLGDNVGVTYFIESEPALNQPRVMGIVLPVQDGRVVAIGLTPADAVVNSDAISMLSTLKVLPKPKP